MTPRDRIEQALARSADRRKPEKRAEPLATWPAFAAAVRARLEQGERGYAGRSFSRDPADLAGEIAQELLDVCGWAFVLWTRPRRIEAALAAGSRSAVQR